jgi:hypothetical protein
MPSSTEQALANAFREVTLSLSGVFEAFDADFSMIDAATDALRKVFRAHLGHTQSADPRMITTSLHKLYDEIERYVED